MASTAPALESCRCSYLVRMIKPNSITSHDWHVQPICQRSFRVCRLSGSLWIEASTRVKVSPNLLRCTNLAHSEPARCRLRDFLRISNFSFPVNPYLSLAQGRPAYADGAFPALRSRLERRPNERFPSKPHCAKYQRSTSATRSRH